MTRTPNQKMADKHEEFLADLFGGRIPRGSGNQWRDQLDGKHPVEEPLSFAWDGKSTKNTSYSVTRKLWAKIKEQAQGQRPMIAIRFYDNDQLDVGEDLVVISAHDFAELREAALGRGGAPKKEAPRVDVIHAHTRGPRPTIYLNDKELEKGSTLRFQNSEIYLNNEKVPTADVYVDGVLKKRVR